MMCPNPSTAAKRTYASVRPGAKFTMPSRDRYGRPVPGRTAYVLNSKRGNYAICTEVATGKTRNLGVGLFNRAYVCK